MTRRCVLPALAALALAALLGGCGGTDNHVADPTGALAVGVRFPAPAASVPARVPTNAASVRLSVLPSVGGAPLVPDTIVNRPSAGGIAEATIGNIPAGPIVVRGVAYPQPGAAGPALAQGLTTALIVGGKTVDVALTLIEIVDKVVATPAEMHLLVKGHGQIVARALDSTGAVIIGAPLIYLPAVPTVATVSDTGVVTALALGRTVVTVRHVASKKEAHVVVEVVRNMSAALAGTYRGSLCGDRQGALTFDVTAAGDLRGTASPTGCSVVDITGTVTPAGTVAWSGTGCGVAYHAAGLLGLPEPTANTTPPVITGGGTWEGSDGSSCEWSATRTGTASGAIG